MLRTAKFLILICATVWGSASFSYSQGTQIDITGTVSYSTSGNSISLQAQKIESKRPSWSYSGTLVLQLWATDATYTGTPLSGYKMAEAKLGQLTGQTFWSQVKKTAPYFAPPNGSRNVVLVLLEWNGLFYQPLDWLNFGFKSFGPSSSQSSSSRPVDFVVPTLRITAPGGNTASTTAGQYTLRGTARDNVFPDRIQFRIRPPASKDYGGWSTFDLSQGTNEIKSWSQTIVLNRKGRWDVQIRVLDKRGNPSLIRTIMITRR